MENNDYRFLGQKSIVFVDFMEHGTTIVTDVFCEVLTKLKCTHLITPLPEPRSFGWELFGHPPYSMDFAPSNYFFAFDGLVDNGLKMTKNLRQLLSTGSILKW